MLVPPPGSQFESGWPVVLAFPALVNGTMRWLYRVVNDFWFSFQRSRRNLRDIFFNFTALV
jgi:hypothetical protein